MRPDAARELATKDRLLNISVFGSPAILFIQYRAAMAASKALVGTKPPILISLHRENSSNNAPVQPPSSLTGGRIRNIVCNSGIVLQYAVTVAFAVQFGRNVAISC